MSTQKLFVTEADMWATYNETKMFFLVFFPEIMQQGG